MRCLVAGYLCATAFGQAADHPPSAAHPTNFADFLLLPLRVHVLTASNAPAVHSTLDPEDVARIISKVNLVWAPGGVHFYAESVISENSVRTEAHESSWKAGLSREILLGLRPEQSKTQHLFHVYYLKHMSVNGVHFPEANFVKDTASLREVPGGIDEPLPRVTSHELGHALSLVHRQNETNLMASRTTGTSLNAEEIYQARTNASSLAWAQRAGEVLRKADDLYRDGKLTEAVALYQRLSRLPIVGPEVEWARRRSN